MIEIPFDENKIQAPQAPLRVEDILGNFPQVTATPTWTPKTFRDQFAIYKNGSTYRLYVYDTANNAWRYASLT
jgi:hypothetical protein